MNVPRIVLRGASIVDGTAAPRFAGDVAVVGDRISEIGSVRVEATDQVVDLDGLVLSPGFVDVHTHYDAQILWDPELTPSPWHGVTTVVMGNCGFTLAPTRQDHRDLICRTLENVEGMSYEALAEGISWDFETFPEWLGSIESRPKRINVGSMIGHSALRLFVMGPDAVERTATPDEIVSMRDIVSEAMQAGALGFATSKSPSHRGAAGRPVPSFTATREEIFEVAAAVGDFGAGVIQATAGPGLFLEEFASLSQQTGRPVTWTAALTQGDASWPPWLEEGHPLRASALELVRRQAALPGTVLPQIACRPVVMQVLMVDPFPFGKVAAFERVLSTPRDRRPDVYRDQSWRDHARPQVDRSWGHRWSKFSVQETKEHRGAIGIPLDQLARQRGTTPFDLLLDLSLAENLRTRFRIVLANDDEDQLAVLLREPNTLITLSDAGAHASQLSDACYATHLLGHWVRERNVLTLEDAVHRLTAQPADIYGIENRGRIAVGAFADLVAFDPATVGPGELERVWDFPAGSDRLLSRPTGVEHVWVNGVPLFDETADAHPGVLVRPRSHVATP